LKVDGIEIEQTIAKAERLLNHESSDKTALLTMLSTMLLLIKILFNQLNLDSHNSSKPPSTNGLKGSKKTSSNSDDDKDNGKKKGNRKKRGGQNGHKGTTLKPVDSPDHIQSIKIDRRTLPKGKYTEAGYVARQVVEIITLREVTEIRAQILVDQFGKEFVAPFPEGVTRPIQYGSSVKANAVYLSQYQLIPFGRIQAQFHEQYNTPISMGTISNFNQEAYDRLEPFEKVVKQELIQANQAHADETGINVDGKLIWLHVISNAAWTYFAAHLKRGAEAMNAIGIIPLFLGVLSHDHWKRVLQSTSEGDY